MNGFAENFLRGLEAGTQQRRQKEQDAKDEELRKLQIDALKHQQKQIELEGRWKVFERQRAGAKEAAAAHEGQSINDLVKTMVSPMGAPTPPPGMAPSAAPPAAPFGAGQGVSARPITAVNEVGLPVQATEARKTFEIPGSQEFGVPGYSVTPKSIEEVMAAAMRAKLMEPTKLGAGETLTVPLTGQVVAQGAPKPRNFQSKNVQAQGFTGMANFDPETGQYFAPGSDQPLQNVKDAPPQVDPTLAAIRDAQLAVLQQNAGQLSPMQQSWAKSLSDDFARDSKDYVVRAQAYQTIKTAASDPSAAGDLVMIFSFMKQNDPGSTVREGEQATAQNAAGVPEQIRNIYNQLLTGERLTPEQRKDFLKQSENQFLQAQKRQRGINDVYRRRAEAMRVPANLVVMDFDQMFGLENVGGMQGMVPMKAPDGRDLLVPGDQVDEAKRRGATVVQ